MFVLVRVALALVVAIPFCFALVICSAVLAGRGRAASLERKDSTQPRAQSLGCAAQVNKLCGWIR